jgi:hypothetical protein
MLRRSLVHTLDRMERIDPSDFLPHADRIACYILVTRNLRQLGDWRIAIGEPQSQRGRLSYQASLHRVTTESLG